ncbi:hypothetical protein TWF102_007050 [Orbilia oligospora]|uniref:Uncharacterized protein n=1 Tax=Orbilia oligospora TaxID=2813651 RepID=A0A7C8NI92_ORBOL|nr:hypothetical protein TWF102_007050 [Orbilia oligospora]KAF3117206.1 hypothetical protein TWF103_007355 [Orbilia oligospora]KAF3150006.1 hypothetical protein TWF594_009912 [Orbilia oligospora]KAF3267153.1 hypothetical protein TWF128_010100 [Orbilia oligospora]
MVRSQSTKFGKYVCSQDLIRKTRLNSENTKHPGASTVSGASLQYRPKSGVKVNPSEHTGIQAIWLILRDSIVCAFNLHAGNSIRGFANQSFVKQGAVSFH